MEKLMQSLAITAELTGQAISPTALAVMAKDLSAYPQEVVIAALGRLRRESKSRMTLAAVIEQVEKLQPDGRPGADEAWAMIPRDEHTSAVMTEEMSEAMGIAQPLLDEGDQVAARMAFKDAYTRIVEHNKRNGIAPRWFPSLGSDKAGHEAVLSEAVRLGRLPANQVAGLLPRSNDGVGITACLIGNSPLRLATVNGDSVEDARTLTNVQEKMAGLRAAIGRQA